MIVDFDKLVALLRQYGDQNDVPAGQDLVVRFSTKPRIVESSTFETIDGQTLLVDLDDAGKVVSIEIT